MKLDTKLCRRYFCTSLSFLVYITIVPNAVGTLWWDRDTGNSDWGDLANWAIGSSAFDPDPGPGSLNGNQFVFNVSELNSTQNINLNDNRNTTSLQFISTGSVSINSGSANGGDNLLTVQGGSIPGVPGTVGILVDTNAGTAQIFSRVRVGGNQDWRVRAGRALNVAGTIDLQNYTLTLTGDGNADLSGQLFGTGSLVKTDGGTLYLTGATANAYTGSTYVFGGTLVLDKTHSNYQAAITGNVFVNGGTLRLAEQGQLGDGFIQIVGSTFDMASYDDTVGELIMVDGLITGDRFASGTPGD